MNGGEANTGVAVGQVRRGACEKGRGGSRKVRRKERCRGRDGRVGMVGRIAKQESTRWRD